MGLGQGDGADPRELGFAFAAGSSLPVTWRMPDIDMPYGAEIEEMLCVAIGGVDSYDFHALETIQCMAERRRGGETGVTAVQGLSGDSVWKAMAPAVGKPVVGTRASWKRASRGAKRYPNQKHLAIGSRPPPRSASGSRDPIAYRIEYTDGTKATMLLMNGLVGDFTFAARLKGRSEPLSTLFYLPPVPNVVYSAALMSKAEETFVTGKSPCPIERTLLTSGMVEACVRSLRTGQKRLETDHLRVRYKAPRESTYWRS